MLFDPNQNHRCEPTSGLDPGQAELRSRLQQDPKLTLIRLLLITVSHPRQDEVLFDSWDGIFNEGRMKDNVPIYSFDGKDVLSDGTW